MKLLAAEHLELHAERQAPTDLAVGGRLAGVPAGEVRFIRWSELASLPAKQLRLTGEFLPGEQVVTGLFLTDLWSALAVTADADALLATCNDGYTSVYRTAFIRTYRPFLVLAINGLPPEHWPPPGLNFNPGPYVISVSAEVVPAVAQLLDAGHKRPWGVTHLEVARFSDCAAGIFQGRWANPSDRASAGREIWINSCASCHQGPPDTFGGTKSDRSFEVLAAQAKLNTAYFKSYIRDPRSFVSTAKMEPHPHYTDAQLDALVAFVTGEVKP